MINLIMLDSLSDWLIFIVVALILFGGSSKIPELARAMGRAMGEFRKAQIEVEREINGLVEGDNKKRPASVAQNTLSDAPPKNSGSTTTALQSTVDARLKELEMEINNLKRILANEHAS